MEFRILGPLEVFDEGQALSIGGAKERSVLALMLLDAGRVVSSDRLLDALWGEEPPATARKSLQVRVAGLRKALGADRIATTPSGYRLRVEPGELDLERFECLVADGDADSLREALALWRGSALAEFEREQWAAAPSARLEELRLAALERGIDAELELGHHAELIAELDALVVAHRTRERFWAQRMLALYRSGRQAEALETYRAARSVLVEEIGIEPGRALQELERAVLKQDPSLELAPLPAPERSILVAAFDDSQLDVLIALAELLARVSRREVILTQPISSAGDLRSTSAGLNRRRELLLEAGVDARAAAFTSQAPGLDVARVAAEQDVDLALVTGPPALLDDRVLVDLLTGAPCDVVVHVGGTRADAGAVLVPFTGAEHDWSAVEIGAWLSRARGERLVLAGPTGGEHDASRLLAHASLAVQRALGVAAEAMLIEPGPDGLLHATAQAGVVVAGLTDRWRAEGLGPVRAALAARSRCPVLLVRRGLRPSGIAPSESHTRFTWSVRATS